MIRCAVDRYGLRGVRLPALFAVSGRKRLRNLSIGRLACVFAEWSARSILRNDNRGVSEPTSSQRCNKSSMRPCAAGP